MKDYHHFWEELKPAYPISGGKIRLSIATDLENFNINHEKIAQELDTVMQKLFNLNEKAKELASKGYSKEFIKLYTNEFTGIVRFDCMFDHNNQLKIIEANTNRPDGLLMHDITYGVLDKNKNSCHYDLFKKLLNKEDSLFILYEEGGFIDPHFLEYNKLKKDGYRVNIGTFKELDFYNNEVFYKGEAIKTIRLSMNSGRLTEKELKLLEKANIRYINSFDFAGLADKSLLQYIEHPMLMKTEVLQEKNKDKILFNKNKYVLKPTNLNEGIGVVIGNESTQEEWQSLIELYINKNYLVQEYITIQKKRVELYINEGTEEKEQYYDYCPHLCYKKGKKIGTGHILVRYSDNKIVNVLRGGGIGYCKKNYI